MNDTQPGGVAHPGGIVDLRSDTVTRPTPEMRRAMAEARVGDDVYGEDETVNRLEAEAARFLGKEAALLTPSGTMANQIAIALHADRGSEVICPEGAHVYEYELGMMAAFAGVVPRLVRAPGGAPDPDDVRLAVRRSIHQSPTALIVLENTHNKAGGTVLEPDLVACVRAVASEEGLALHLDGARLCNAAVALGSSASELAGPFDTVSLCLSKGLGAPVGSVLAGPAKLMNRARRYRKMLGGGMRQAGILAAAGLLALRDGPSRLPADHARARRLAGALATAGWDLDLASVQTNMVYARVPDAPARARGWAEQGVLAGAIDHETVRLVTHFQVDDAGLERAIQVLTA